MSDQFDQNGGGAVYGWLIYASAALMLIAIIMKYIQVDRLSV
ncbi:MAG: hypothetical protein ABIF71_13035 [Planctomycetota bacterium]